MTPPLVSIVIPTYDRVAYVETAIDSVLAQDHPRIELIVIDDGSRDETPELLARIAERADPERFRWLRHDNVGQAATINRGLAEARGDLLGYLSSDDYLLPGSVSRLVAAAVAHPEADVLYPWFHVVDERDRVVDTIEAPPHTLAGSLRDGICEPGVGALVRRRLYERIGGWDESLRTCPDYEWWLRAGEAPFVVIPEVGGAWRIHDGSISIGMVDTEHVDERLRVLDAVYARDDLSEEVRATRDDAYAAVLIQGAAGLMSSPAEHRYKIVDTLVESYSRAIAGAETHARMRLETALASAERQLAAAVEASDQARQTIEVLQDAALHREQRIARLEGELAAARAQLGEAGAPTGRPAWLRAARGVVPESLRPRVGAVYHRLRRSLR